MSPEPKIEPLPKCPQNCNWSTAWCLKSILQDATTATSYIIDNFGMRDLFGRDNYEYYARLTGRILKVTPNEYCQKRSGANSLSSGGGRVDLLHLPLGLPWHSQRPRPRFAEPKVGEPLILLKIQSKWVNFSHHEHDPTGSLEMIPENCPLDPVPCSWS